MSGDWLPSTREARHEMAKVWEGFIGAKAAVLNMPDAVFRRSCGENRGVGEADGRREIAVAPVS